MQKENEEGNITELQINQVIPKSLPAPYETFESMSSNATILKDDNGVEPGCVEIIPRNLVIVQLLTWLYSLHTETKYFSVNLTFVTGLRCTVNVWNNWGP